MRKLRAVANSVALLIALLVIRPALARARTTRDLRVQNGRLLVNGRLEHPNFSLTLQPFRYLFLYVPSHGLYVISSEQFDNANECGSFSDTALSFRAGDADIRIESSSRILSDGQAPSWVRFDPNFRPPDAKDVVFGYGDQSTTPSWLELTRWYRSRGTS